MQQSVPTRHNSKCAWLRAHLQLFSLNSTTPSRKLHPPLKYMSGHQRIIPGIWASAHDEFFTCFVTFFWVGLCLHYLKSVQVAIDLFIPQPSRMIIIYGPLKIHCFESDESFGCAKSKCQPSWIKWWNWNYRLPYLELVSSRNKADRPNHQLFDSSLGALCPSFELDHTSTGYSYHCWQHSQVNFVIVLKFTWMLNIYISWSKFDLLLKCLWRWH